MRPRPLLFLAQNLPYPPDGGVKIRTFNVLRELAKSFDVTTLCFMRETGRDPALALRALGEYGPIEAFPIPQLGSRTRMAWDHLRSVSMRHVYTRYMYESARFGERLRYHRQRNAGAIIHFDTLDLATFLPLCDLQRVVCTHHNVESALLARRAPLESAWWRRAYLGLQASFMGAEEKMWCPRVRLNVAVSDVDAAELRRVAPGANVTVVPNGVDTEFFQPLGHDEPAIAFVGGTTWFPNRDALEFFAGDILPLLRAKRGDVRVRWIGRSSPGEMARYRREGAIDMVGYVEDVRTAVGKAACYIVPLRVGGGTRLKILDAWAMGKAVVSTSIGCEGLAAVDGHNILIRDEPCAFAEAVSSVLADEGLRARIGAQGRRTAEDLYSWKVIGERMTQQYRETFK